MSRIRRMLFTTCCAGGMLFMTSPQAAFLPTSFDVPILWAPLPNAGYLNFVEPGPSLNANGTLMGIPGVATSGTEEYTGWVGAPASAAITDATPDVVPGPNGDLPFDNGATHGDRVDFDFVVENRIIEEPSTGNPNPPPPDVLPNHPNVTGLMTWEIGATQPSSHIDPLGGAPHLHSGLTPPCADGSSFICLSDFATQGVATFNTVDVFSVIATSDPFSGNDVFGLVSDTELSARDAALDYFVAFCNAFTGQCAQGTPVTVFVPGWTSLAVADDYVTRWRSPFPATHVGIDPPATPDLDGFGVDKIVQIDAIVAANIPEPSTLALVCIAFIGSIVRAQKLSSARKV
ncbi:hypothetical protein [Thauera aminoaromatica]|uniref:hypothetical protein n=1 Tax=Thauera aminoaromatica TaxID=164330 RepID=UPI0035B27330